MSFKLEWDKTGDKLYETGVERGVLYPYSVEDPTNPYPKGVAWNGLINFSESPSGAEPTALYANNIKYLNLMSTEEYGFSLEAYSSPEEFDLCDGCADIAPGVSIGQQDRQLFGFSCKTRIGSDADADKGYKLHLIYGAQASPSEKGYGTINDSPEAITLSWECTANPVNIPGFKPTASIVIDSTKVPAAKLAAFETILYGKPGAPEIPGIPADYVVKSMNFEHDTVYNVDKTPEIGVAYELVNDSTGIVLDTQTCFQESDGLPQLTFSFRDGMEHFTYQHSAPDGQFMSDHEMGGTYSVRRVGTGIPGTPAIEACEPRLPLPEEVMARFTEWLFRYQYLEIDKLVPLPAPTLGVSYTIFVDGTEAMTRTCDNEERWAISSDDGEYGLVYVSGEGWGFDAANTTVPSGTVSIYING